MAKPLTRRQALVGAATLLPLAGLAASPALLSGQGTGAPRAPLGHAAAGHAAMIGAQAPAPGGPNDLDALLYPPPPLPHQPGRVREYEVVAVDKEIEVARGVTFPAWTYNGTVPGPVIRATQDDILRVRFANAGSHPHTIHFHGIHPANMDGVFEIVNPGEELVYEFPARPYGMQLYHCHATPLKKHIHKGLYGAFIIDPPEPRPHAQETRDGDERFDTDGDGGNNFSTVNGKAFYYAKYPIRVRRAETVRIYLANLTEFDFINSLHLHGEFFRYFQNSGLFMFHAHQSEFAELGWMGFFEVVDEPSVNASWCGPGSPPAGSAGAPPPDHGAGHTTGGA